MINQFTDHATTRSAQWNLSPSDIEFVVQRGLALHKAGVLVYYLRKRDLADQEAVDQRLARLDGTAVVLTTDGCQVITVWRNRRKGLPKLKRKVKYELSGGQLGCRR